MAFEETFSPLDRDEGNEEKADIVVQAFEPRGGQPTAGTDPRLVIHGHSFGLHSTDENEGAHLRIIQSIMMEDRKPLVLHCKIFRIFPQ
jgi:hypothetical protein